MFYQIWEAITKSQINESFVMVIFCLFVLAAAFHRMRFAHKFVSVTPNLLTGIGVLGTFLGIFLGLLEFNVRNINGSVEELLAGMTTAFITSICGMSASIVMRVIIATVPQRDADEADAKTAEEFMEVVEEIAEAVKASDKNFQQVIKAISGDGDSSIATQLTKMRSDSNDNHREVIKELKDFTEQLTKNSTEAIVEALEKVVKDFNEQINEQFGDNFRQLNGAVGRLLEWQENYKEELQHMQDQFKRCLESIERVEIAMASIKEKTEAIPSAMERLPEIVKTATDTLDAFAQMKNQAIEAFPTIEENFTILTSGLRSQVQAFEAALEAQKENYQRLESSFEGVGQKTQEVITTAMSEIQTSMTENIRHTTAELKDNFSKFDDQMKKEIEKALTDMGEILVSLHSQIAQDYAPMLEALQELIEYMDVRKNEGN